VHESPRHRNPFGIGENISHRLERGAVVRGSTDPVFRRAVYAQLEGTKHLIRPGGGGAVSFFAYPGKPMILVPMVAASMCRRPHLCRKQLHLVRWLHARTSRNSCRRTLSRPQLPTAR